MKKIRMLSIMLCSVMIVSAAEFRTAAQNDGINRVYLGGEPFGVKFYNDGVMIINLEEFFDGKKYVCPAKDSGLKTGDVIKKVNGKSVNSNEDMIAGLEESGGKTASINVERRGKILEKEVTPAKNTAGIYLLGAWIRDSCAGIGTITYYDSENSVFAALGHGICDNDTAELMPLGSAEIVGANISSVTKSVDGKPGSLNGYFDGETVGSLTKNTTCGIYGTIFDNTLSYKREIEVADFNEIKLGNATIYTTINGVSPQPFTARITRFCNSNPESNENFVIKITDRRLVKECGGIVQGMSGSPIVQNGKLIGAVTHVFINNTDEGYGISAQFMLSNYKK